MSLVDLVTELFYDGGWHDITPDVLTRQAIRVNQGLPVEGNRAHPGRLTLQVRGGESEVVPGVVGRYSPLNPRSDLYGKINLYTPIRVRVPSSGAGLWLPNIQDGDSQFTVPQGQRTTAWASTPDDTGALNTTGDIDVRIDVTPAAWEPPHADVLIGKFEWSTQLSWALTLQGGFGGWFIWRWSEDGGPSFLTQTSAAPHGLTAGRATVRVTMTADDGAGNRVVRFFVGLDGVDGPFQQLGGDAVGAATSIFASTAAVEVGAMSGGQGLFAGTQPLRGTVHRVQVRGNGGLVVLDTDFAAVDPGTVAFTDPGGLEWTLQNAETSTPGRPLARIIDPAVRARMEVTSWPLAWEPSGNVVWMPVEAAGVIERLSSQPAPDTSTVRETIEADPDVVAYWPCEDQPGSTQFAAADPDAASPLLIRQIDPGLPEASGILPGVADVFPGSRPVARMQTGGIASQHGLIGSYAAGATTMSGLFTIPAGGLGVETPLLSMSVFEGAGGIFFVTASYVVGGSLRVDVHHGVDFDQEEQVGPVAFNVDGRQFVLAVGLSQDGPDVDVVIDVEEADDLPGELGSFTETLQGLSFGSASRVRVGHAPDGLWEFGHVAVAARGLDFGRVRDVAVAAAGRPREMAADRFLRACDQSGVPAVIAAAPGAPAVPFADSGVPVGLTEPMGATALRIGLLAKLRECADADHGLMVEVRDQPALGLVPGRALYHQGPELVLDYEAEHLQPPLRPVFDARLVANDVTVTRAGGSSARAVATTGPLSNQDPPAGIGRKPRPETLNIATDAGLDDHAAVFLAEGQSGDLRYPSVVVDVTTLRELGRDDLAEAILRLEPGMRLDITRLPEWLPGDEARLVVRGIEERISEAVHLWTANCGPLGPRGEVAAYAAVGATPAPDAPQRYSPPDTRVEAVFDAGVDTELVVRDHSGVGLLSETAGFPLDVAVSGVRSRVTAVGAPVGAVQTLTVEQAPVNGVTKTIGVGERVEMWRPARYAL